MRSDRERLLDILEAIEADWFFLGADFPTVGLIDVDFPVAE